MIDISQLIAQRRTLMIERERFVTEANQRIGYLNGQIEAYEQMIAMLESEGVNGSGTLVAPVPEASTGD